jgi:hypothetical protein
LEAVNRPRIPAEEQWGHIERAYSRVYRLAEEVGCLT